MKRLLFISYFFPPQGGSGVQRVLKTARYLGENGFDVDILTVNPTYIRGLRDTALLAQIPSSMKIHRTFTFDLNWIFKLFWGLRLPAVVQWLQQKWLIPDKDIFWIPFARKQGRKLCRSNRYDLLLVSGSPFSSFTVARTLSREFNIPYVVDFRDEWMNNQTRLLQRSNPLRDRIEGAMERDVMETATGFVFLSEMMQQNFVKRYPALESKPQIVMTNGYDEDDFTSLQPHKRQDGRLHMVYTGSFYDTTNPGSILNAILRLIRGGVITAGKIRLEIYGKNTPSFIFRDVKAQPGELDFVELHPYVSHRASLQLQIDADVLLIYIITAKNTDAVYNGKTFEYIRSGTPILAIVPPHGLAADVIRQTETGIIADSADEQAIETAIRDIYERWEKSELTIQPNHTEISRYERSNLVREFSAFLTTLTEEK